MSVQIVGWSRGPRREVRRGGRGVQSPSLRRVTGYMEECAVLGHGTSMGLCVGVRARCASLGKARGSFRASRSAGVMEGKLT
jgi:hypothetical protein